MIIANSVTLLLMVASGFMILDIAVRILLALAVYNDAKNRGNNDPVMWAVLVGLFELIPGIAYLCMRNNARNRLMVCPNCGCTHRVNELECPQCRIHNRYSMAFIDNPLAEEQAQKAKTFLIIALVLLAVSILLAVFATVWITSILIASSVVQ